MLISVGQALLILLDHNKENLNVYNELKVLYLSGASNQDNLNKLLHYLSNNPALNGYSISMDPTITNDDPTRRYFETHLAQHTINNTPLSVNELENYFKAIVALLPHHYFMNSRNKTAFESVINGYIHTTKFEYQTKLNTFIKKMEAAVNNEALTLDMIALEFEKIKNQIQKEIDTKHLDNYIESEYKNVLTYIKSTIGKYNMPSKNNLDKILQNTKHAIKNFNGIFDKHSKDPAYDNTGREFSTIIHSAANEKEQLSHLKEKIGKINQTPSPKAFVEIYELLEKSLSKFHNNKTKEYLQIIIERMKHIINNDDIDQENYNDIISALQKNLSQGIESLKKVYVVARCGYVSTLIALLTPNKLPLGEVYNQGYYTPEQRGRIIKDASQTSTRSANWGILKSYMPTSIDDIAHANHPFDFMRYVEHGDFAQSGWTEHSFNQLVHPFSNSISGTMLIQARTLLALLEKQQGLSQDQAKAYFKLFASTFLFAMGSHSLYEFIAPLSIPTITTALKTSEAFDLNNLFLQSNYDAFEKALTSTIEYNSNLLKRRLLNEEIKTNKIQLKHVEMNQHKKDQIQEECIFERSPNLQTTSAPKKKQFYMQDMHKGKENHPSTSEDIYIKNKMKRKRSHHSGESKPKRPKNS